MMNEAATDLLRIVVVTVFVGFFLLMLYREFSFSYSSPTRRYVYRKRFPGEPEFEVAGSGFFRGAAIKTIAMVPRYNGEPQRQILDTKRNVVVYDSFRV